MDASPDHPLHNALLKTVHEELTFNREHSENLEQKLKYSFTEEDALSLHLPAHTVPKIYRGLPRLYHQDDPTLWKLKSHFSDLPSLKKAFLDKAVLHLYTSRNQEYAIRIVLFTWVIPDGLGDFFAQQQIASIIKTQFPSAHIELITLIPQGISLPHPTFSSHILFYEGTHPAALICKELSFVFQELVNKADLLIQVPTYFSQLSHHLEHVSHRVSYELIGEFGLIDRAWFHPKAATRCMGFHFLEKGIYLNGELKKVTLAKETFNERIKGILFKNKFPSPAVIDAYKKNHRFNLNYTKSKRGNYFYFHILLKALEDVSQTIDICFSNMDCFVDERERYFELMKTKNVATVHIYYKNHFSEISLKEKGKLLRLIHIELLSHEDFIFLLSLSDDLVGCTGDGSFSEALSAKKPFFYDPPYHKRNFLKDFVALIEHRLQNCPSFKNFYHLSMPPPSLSLEDRFGPWITEDCLKTSPASTEDSPICEKMGTWLKQPDFMEGIEKISKIVDEEYNISEILCQLVHRAYIHQHFPDIEEIEKDLLDNFAQGKMRAIDVLRRLRKCALG